VAAGAGVSFGIGRSSPGNLVKESPRYAKESEFSDMADPDNHYRYLKHIDMIAESVNVQQRVKIDDLQVLFPMKPYQV